MAAKKKKEKIFNDRPRKVFRKRIGASELAFSVFFIGFTIAMGVWFATRKDKYDPGERDISIEILVAQQVEDHLWEPPLQRWVEPGSMPAGGGAPLVDLGIFPASVIGNGWAPASRLQVFDETNLYEKINGQETQYRAFGFQAMHYISITNASAELDINIELYDMGEFQNALGVFAAQRSAGSVVVNEDNTFYYLTQAGALGIVDKFYYKFTGNADSDAIREHALQIIRDFSAGVEDSGTVPRAFMILTTELDVDFGGVEYQLGDVFQYDFAKDFWFGRPDADSNARYFLHEAADAEAAAALFEQILEEHLWDYELVSRDGNNAVLHHEFLKTYSTLNQDGKFVFGIENAADPGAAAQSLETLASKLMDGSA